MELMLVFRYYFIFTSNIKQNFQNQSTVASATQYLYFHTWYHSKHTICSALLSSAAPASHPSTIVIVIAPLPTYFISCTLSSTLLPPPARPALSTLPRSTSMSRAPSKPQQSSRPGSFNTARRPSTASDRAPSDRGSSINDTKKRPFKQTNGGSNSKANGSPAAKRMRRRAGTEELNGDDPRKDPNFSPEDAGDVEAPTIEDSDASDE